MKKLLSFFAFVAIVISFAACSGNNPEVKNFQIKVQTLSDKAHFVITPPANNQKEYYFWWEKKSVVEGKGTVRDYAEYDLSVNTYEGLESFGLIQTEKTDFWIADFLYHLDPNTPYVLYVFFIEVDGDYAKIDGEVEYVEFTTMPEYTLNGEFTVDANGKKVHFSQANLQNNNDYYFFDNQWDYSGSYSDFPIDLFYWDAIINCPSPFYVLSKDEWWYLLKTRPNADKLFAHATVNGVHGLILLPDNWKTPDGIQLTTSYQMGIVWNENDIQYEHSETYYDGYGQNKYDDKTWKVLEYAGAVFMPATWSSNNAGWYWTSSEKDDGAYEFSYGDYDLILSRLRVLQPKEDYASFRLVRDVNY